MDNYVIKETTIWGNAGSEAKNFLTMLRLKDKKSILQKSTSFPFVDHYTIYAYKPANQRGPAKDSQTFIVSYAYNYDSFIGDKEAKFIEKLTDIDLRFYKEKCLYSGHDAYKILILDTDVDLDKVLQFLANKV